MTDLDYHTLQHAIPHLDTILTAALHDRRVGWSDRAIYQSVTDAVAASQACYATQRIALDLCRDALGIPDSIEDARSTTARMAHIGTVGHRHGIEGAERDSGHVRTVTSRREAA